MQNFAARRKAQKNGGKKWTNCKDICSPACGCGPFSCNQVRLTVTPNRPLPTHTLNPSTLSSTFLLFLPFFNQFGFFMLRSPDLFFTAKVFPLNILRSPAILPFKMRTQVLWGEILQISYLPTFSAPLAAHFFVNLEAWQRHSLLLWDGREGGLAGATTPPFRLSLSLLGCRFSREHLH